MNPTALSAPKGYATVLIDYENLFYDFKNTYPNLLDPQECVLETVRALQQHLREKLDLEPLVTNAYADFERLGPSGQLGAFYLMGVNTFNVLGTKHKNAADMQLSIDALEVLYTRPDITTFVFMAGDRDYIPVIQHLRRKGRQIVVVGTKHSTSGDLLQIVGEQHYIEAESLLSVSRRAGLLLAAVQSTPAPPPMPTVVIEASSATEASESAPRQWTPGALHYSPRPVQSAIVEHGGFLPTRVLTGANAQLCLTYLLDDAHEHKSNEVWLSPFLRRLTDTMSELPDFERRDLINELRDYGCIRIEKRDGQPFPFSVVLFNYAHPDVVNAIPA